MEDSIPIQVCNQSINQSITLINHNIIQSVNQVVLNNDNQKTPGTRVLMRGENRSTRGNTSWNRVQNQHTQRTLPSVLARNEDILSRN